MSKEDKDVSKDLERARECLHKLIQENYFTGDLPIDDQAPLRNRYQLDSIGFVKIIHILEKALGLRFQAKEVNNQNFCTIECILQLVAKKLQAERE